VASPASAAVRVAGIGEPQEAAQLAHQHLRRYPSPKKAIRRAQCKDYIKHYRCAHACMLAVAAGAWEPPPRYNDLMNLARSPYAARFGAQPCQATATCALSPPNLLNLCLFLGVLFSLVVFRGFQCVFNRHTILGESRIFLLLGPDLLESRGFWHSWGKPENSWGKPPLANIIKNMIFKEPSLVSSPNLCNRKPIG